MNVQEKRMTVEEFLALPDDGNDYELLEGERVPMWRPKPVHNVVGRDIVIPFTAHVDQHDLGLVTYELGCTLSVESGSFVFPDIAFFSKARLPNPDLTEYLPVAPDLAIEIVSPNDVAEKLMDKIGAYFKAGTQIVWVVYPDEQLIQVYRGSIVNVTGVGIEGTVDGGDVLPSFKLPLRDIFKHIGSQS